MIPDIDRMDVPAVINKIIQLKQSSMEVEPLVKKTEDLVKAGKLVPEKISTFGTKPILPPDAAGFVWREVVDPVATRIQAKMLNNSIPFFIKSPARDSRLCSLHTYIDLSGETPKSIIENVCSHLPPTSCSPVNRSTAL